VRLNLPNLDELLACRSLLIAGMGGGFDVYAGLPIYLELRERGANAHLANLTFAQVQYTKQAEQLSEHLIGITPETRSVLLYFPERHLLRWLADTRDIAATVWCFQAGGARPLTEAYRLLAEHLSLDGILLVDGGVDSLMRGDEAELGTVLEDSLSLAAVNALTEIPFRQIGCLGFGVERDLTHAHVLENIAALTGAGAFHGVCSLTPAMPSFQAYAEAVEYVHAQRGQDPSVIHSSVVGATQGHYGDYHTIEKTQGKRLYLSPLMPLYWFFDLPAVAARNLLLTELAHSTTAGEAMATLARYRSFIPPRPSARIPL
jgi:hypothetical protein